jgi:tetratricopeptide (TPR) repeat protein
VLPIHLLRDRWPALPLPKSSFAVAPPAMAAVSIRYDAAVAALDTAVYAARLAELEDAAKGLSAEKELRVRMRQGILHALYGRWAEAEKVFRAAQKKDPAMVSPYVNIANLKIIAGDLDGAIATLREGIKKVSDPTLINLALARCYADKGDAKTAAVYLAELKKTSADLAQRFSTLAAQPQASSARGSFGGGFEPSLWSSED